MALGGVPVGKEVVCVCGFEAGFHCVARLTSDLEQLFCPALQVPQLQAHTSTPSKPQGLMSSRSRIR